MVLIFGGTTEGRVAARVCDGASKPFYYSTKGEGQRVDAANVVQLSGAMTCDDIVAFCRQNDIRLIVDAAHPFAEILHKSVVDAAEILSAPVVRYERNTIEPDSKVCYVASMQSAVEYIQKRDYKKVVALTGVKSSLLLAPLASNRDLWLRIMDREESWQIVDKSGFPRERVIIYGEQDDRSLLSRLAPEVIITKESGESGGVPEKIRLAKELGIDLIVVERPRLSGYSDVVYGEIGLRMAIDRALPEFFELAIGLTTGSCAAAASVAALRALVSGQRCDCVEFTIPSGEHIIMDIAALELGSSMAKASVFKFAGDDPDVTDGAEISAQISIFSGNGNITIRGGEGVGSVTLPGLALEVGSSAINATPRQMIVDNLRRELKNSSASYDIDVVISVPMGRELAKRTFNERLGIVDGISILGTSGIVHPFSREAFLASIERHIEVVKALGHDRIVINSGGKSERFLKSHFSDMPTQLFVQYGNMVGDTLKLCSEAGLREVTLGMMIGKAVKLADGNLDTHSKNSVMNSDFIAELAREVGYSSDIVDKIYEMRTALQLWDIVAEGDVMLFDRLKELCYRHCSSVIDPARLRIVLVRGDGRIF